MQLSEGDCSCSRIAFETSFHAVASIAFTLISRFNLWRIKNGMFMVNKTVLQASKYLSGCSASTRMGSTRHTHLTSGHGHDGCGTP